MRRNSQCTATNINYREGLRIRWSLVAHRRRALMEKSSFTKTPRGRVARTASLALKRANLTTTVLSRSAFGPPPLRWVRSMTFAFACLKHLPCVAPAPSRPRFPLDAPRHRLFSNCFPSIGFQGSPWYRPTA